MAVADDDQLGWLELERIDRDILRGSGNAWRREGWSLYGGQVAAQALVAAASTVPSGRTPHSLHGYFLRPGDQDRPVIYMVERDRDGRSFSARRVAAVQDGSVIWEMACSFHEPAEGSEYTPPAPIDVAPPESSAAAAGNAHPILDIRVPPSDLTKSTEMPVDRAWVRINRRLGDDPLIHASLHVYASDVTTGFERLDLSQTPAAGPSIDHAYWFHHPSRADDWVLYNSVAAKVGGHRGLYTATAHDRAGLLVAFLAQEMLLRPTDGVHQDRSRMP